LRADCIAWLAGRDAFDASGVPDLLALGQLTGTAVLLSTADPVTEATTAYSVGTVVVSGPRRPTSQERGQFSVITRVEPPDAAPRITTGCVVVPITAEPQR
jgi:hypothetical protein